MSHDASVPLRNGAPSHLDSGDRVHVWNTCHGCGAAPILGYRFECQTCPDGPDNDLCERCHAAYVAGKLEHPKPGSFSAFAEVAPGRRHPFVEFGGAPPDDCVGWSTIPDGGSFTPPVVPNGFVVRPEFSTGRTSFVGSYGCVVGGRRTLVLTCLHVMSSLMQNRGIDASAKNAAYTGRELPAVLKGVNLYDVFAANWMMAPLGRAGSMLRLLDARTKEPEPLSNRDLAAFIVDDPSLLSPLPLAPRVPRVGDPIWLAVKSDGGLPQRTIMATVVEHTERTLIFRYVHDGRDIPRFASGAPLLDRAGEVVGINVGLGRFDGRTFGHANHVESIRHHLDLA